MKNFVRMETPIIKSAFWAPQFYGQAPSFVKGKLDIQFFLPGKSTDYLLSTSDEATAVKTIIKSITHPEYGDIEGVFNDGLDLHIVKCDGTAMHFNGEDTPGEIDGTGEILSTDPFSLRLRNPNDTGVTRMYYGRLFIQKSAKLMRDFEEDRIKKALNIP